jgi:hypothetical protein
MLNVFAALLLSLPGLAAPSPLAAFLAAPPAERAAKLIETGVAVVNVESDSAVGTGVLFLLDGKPRILTASHVLESQKTALVTGVFSALKPVSARIVLDLPADDLAVLAPADGAADPAVLAAIAKASLRVCTRGESCTLEPADGSDALNTEMIVTAAAGVPAFVRPQNRYFLGTKVADEYVSGSYPYLWRIGAYTRSGVSGGAYYRAGVFAGLVTKVSRGLQSLTIAIPAEGIAASLRAGSRSGAAWLDGNRLEVREDGKVIVQAFREGGDVSNGGDDKHPTGGEPRAWNLLLTGCFYCMGDIKRVIENPFVDATASAHLLIDGSPVAAFSGRTLQAASLARYRYLRGRHKFFRLESPGSPALERLAERRAARPFDMRFFQVFRKRPGDVLENSRPMEGNFHDGVTVFLLGLMRGGTLSPYPQIFGSNRNGWLELNYPDERLHFRIADDLSSVEILSAGTQGPVSLPARPLANPVKALYGGKGGVRALFLYDESDLTRVQSFMIETPEKVYQLNFCHPNVGCGVI